MVLVFRLRSPRMQAKRVQKQVDLYLRGREGSTMKSYESSYRALCVLCRASEVSVFSLGEAERCQLWSMAREMGFTASKVRGISAVLALVNEVMGTTEVVSGRERTIKKGLLKESNLLAKPRKKREVGVWQDVERLIKGAERSGKFKDWRTAVLATVCFFGCKRFGDVNRVKVEDVVMSRDTITVFMRKSKTDELNEGASFKMEAAGKKFSIREFLQHYIRRFGLRDKDGLFPASLTRGSKGTVVSYAVMYHSLEAMKKELNLDAGLTWHSFRIGSATRGTKLGVRRSVIKGAGLWRSSCVDVYCREEEAGVVLSRELLNDI